MGANSAPRAKKKEGEVEYNTGEEMKQNFQTIVDTLVEQQQSQVDVLHEAAMLAMRGINPDIKTHSQEFDAMLALKNGLQTMQLRAESDLVTLKAAQSDPLGYFAKITETLPEREEPRRAYRGGSMNSG